MQISAADLQVGDIIHHNKHITGRVEEIIGVTARMITYRFTYLRCDQHKVSVGKTAAASHRLRTMVEIEPRKENA